jgi:hypothetical protein
MTCCSIARSRATDRKENELRRGGRSGGGLLLLGLAAILPPEVWWVLGDQWIARFGSLFGHYLSERYAGEALISARQRHSIRDVCRRHSWEAAMRTALYRMLGKFTIDSICWGWSPDRPIEELAPFVQSECLGAKARRRFLSSYAAPAAALRRPLIEP